MVAGPWLTRVGGLLLLSGDGGLGRVFALSVFGGLVEKLRSPWWLVSRVNLLLVLVPALYGWWWAFGNFHLAVAARNALVFGVVSATLAAAFLVQRHLSGVVLFERLALVYVFSALASPAMVVYLYVAGYYPGVYLGVVLFLSTQFGVRAVRGVRRLVAGLRAAPT